MVYVRQGKVDEAWPYFEKALEYMPNDAHTKIAMAEACLAQGNFSEALNHAESSLGIDEGVLTIDVEMAISYLACMRARFSLGIFDRIAFDTQKVKNVAVRSPREICLTCFLLASIPEDKLKSINISIPGAADSLANQAFFLNEDSPICLSARGAAAWMNSRYDKALIHLNAARNARRNWPDDIKRQHWYENARDLYFLAMTHHAKECGKKYESCDGRCTDIYLQKAEDLYAEHYNPFGEYADILKNVRRKAFAVLGITMEDESDQSNR
jgi:tetratricopeptide (TPR) repeat protein